MGSLIDTGLNYFSFFLVVNFVSYPSRVRRPDKNKKHKHIIEELFNGSIDLFFSGDVDDDFDSFVMLENDDDGY